MQLRSLRAGLDGSVAHLAHNLLVKDALVTMLSRARLYADAAMEMTYMEISYEAHLARHPAMHVFAVTLDWDLNPSLQDMRQEFLRRMVFQDGRMNVFVMREYLFGMRVRPPSPPRTSLARRAACLTAAFSLYVDGILGYCPSGSEWQSMVGWLVPLLQPVA